MRFNYKTLLGIGLSTLLLSSVQAKEIPLDNPLPANFVPSAEIGLELARTTCGTCHGLQGDGVIRDTEGNPRLNKAGEPMSMGPTFPRLAGQHPEYILQQLRSLQISHMDPERAKKEGIYRVEVQMMPYVSMPMMGGKMLDSEMAAHIAAWFSSQKPVLADAAKTPSNEFETRIDYLYRGGDVNRNIPACSSCHSPSGMGNGPAKYPMIAGQYAQYTEKQLFAFKNSRAEKAVRSNDPERMMRDIAERLTDEEIKGLAKYIETLQIKRPTIRQANN